MDSIRYIKKIPDATFSGSCRRFIELISELPASEVKVLVSLSQKYPFSCRALLGAILQQLGQDEFLYELHKSLNPITQYQLAGSIDALSYSEKWNIV